ncbi:major facilitator superfamily transporter 16 isoform b [Holotrichia oblita]|uniref:Major facilitator superfamily transporter 16 isoform b n=1 Tax=Holotrichia oblita TaxID=644536 RepID=A0ACB9SLQ7_HOLOL|nr:major facilitator superfamily transporter 16 isoform b [Holotrichia oblita]
MSSFGDNIPIGVKLLQKLTDSCPRLHFNREWYYRSSVLVLTYFAYMSYHLSRKPLSVVKAVLYQNCSQLTPSTDVPPSEINTWCDWAPFDDSDADALLGTLDSAFLFAYAIAMFASGFIAERINLRYFLSIGMLLSGIFCYLFGIAKTYNIHNFGYLLFMQAMAGIAQTTGWPGVVTVVGNWFGKSKRGLIFGIWNSHTSIGNILGSIIAGKYVETDWSLSFIIPGFIIGAVGFIIFLFLVVRPTDVGCIPPDRGNKRYNNPYRVLENRAANIEPPSGESSETDDTEVLIGEQDHLKYYATTQDFEIQRRLTERSYLLSKQQQEDSEQAIGFIGACRIPGVIEFSSCLFFSKLVSYTFLYWLPLYVKSSTEMGAALSADFSTLFDVGGIVGAILAGVVSDYSGMSATTCVVMLWGAAPMMFVYLHFGSVSITVNILLLIIVGILVNGPYALITTAVSAELGTHSSLEGNSKALATVTAIIDGTGSIGAAVGPLLAGCLKKYGWQSVFYMLMAADALALLFLIRLVKQELKQWKHRRQIRRD